MNAVRPAVWIRPLGFWCLAVALPGLWVGLFLGPWGWTTEELSTNLWWFGTLGQAAMDLTALGLLGERRRLPAELGGNRHLRSALVGLSLALVIGALRFAFVGHLMGGRFMGGVPAFTQAWDLGGLGSLLAIPAFLAYGPGEALLVLAWLGAWDRVVHAEDRTWSPAIVVTAVLWSLPHLLNLPLQGSAAWINTATMLGVGLVFGCLAKLTRSPWGPTIFWSLTNGTSL